jgi:hypothetical protein
MAPLENGNKFTMGDKDKTRLAVIRQVINGELTQKQGSIDSF